MNYALFLTSYSEVRKVREYETLAEAERAAAEDNDALALIYVPPASQAYYRAFERVTLDDGSYTWREPVQTDNVVPIRRGQPMQRFPAGEKLIATEADLLNFAHKEAKAKERDRKREALRAAAEAYVITIFNQSTLVGSPMKLYELEVTVGKIQMLIKEALLEFTNAFRAWCPRLEACLMLNRNSSDPFSTLEIHVEVIGD